MSEAAPDWYQYQYCAVCLEVQRELEAKGEPVQLAITTVYGTAVCEEHRRRVDGFGQAVFGAKRFLGRDERGGFQTRRG